MRRLTTYILSCALLFLFTPGVYANSGPVFWQGYPSTDVVSVIKDSPIAVERENLIFDFSGRDDFPAYTVSGRVTATYSMSNQTGEPQSVQMAFPFVGTVNGLAAADTVIAADGSALPYEVYIGDAVRSHGNPQQENFDFAGIVGTITGKTYQAESFVAHEKGRLYTIEVKPAAGQRINFAVDFDFDQEKTKVLVSGFNRYERDGRHARIAAWCYEPEILEIYVLGQDIELEASGYTDGGLAERTELFTHCITTQEAELKPYLLELVRKDGERQHTEMIAEVQLYNLYANALDQEFAWNMGFATKDDLIAQDYSDRILTLVYTVDFPANGTKEVSVRYRTSGTMDRTQTAKPLYTFDYILNPAENWNSFKNLDIRVIPPQEAPYIVKSSIEFARGEDGVYTAALAELPADDLSFTLYADEKVTLWDRAQGRLQKRFGYFAPIVMGAVVILIAGAVAGLVGRRNNRNRN